MENDLKDDFVMLMNKPKFSPAPWHESDDISDPCYIVGSNGRAICSIKYHEPYDEAEANAQLIACAPSFYEDEEKKLVFLRTLKNSILPAIRKLPGLYFEVSEMLNVSVQSIDIIIRETEELLAKARGEVTE
jgi:hypothetical protein